MNVDPQTTAAIGAVTAGVLMGAKIVMDLMPKNGKTPVTATQLRESIDKQEVACRESFRGEFAGLNDNMRVVYEKLDKLISEAHHTHVLITEHISNHGARITGLERAVEEIRRMTQ